MPYLYTLAEEASRDGLPILRPLFLEFPDAASDGHPIDIDVNASSEFLLGADLLIAPQPYPDELDTYEIEFHRPIGITTGRERNLFARFFDDSHSDAPAVPDRDGKFSIHVIPKLSQLPVFVRAGSILPIAPVVQSTNETPQGPLTLRVYLGDKCEGELYQDDGKTYAFQHGGYLRMKLSCQKTVDGLRLTIGPHEGSYPAWWKEIHAEIYGFTPKQGGSL